MKLKYKIRNYLIFQYADGTWTIAKDGAPKPSNGAGYNFLNSLLKLKGLSFRDLVKVRTKS